MGLADALKAESGGKTGARCAVCITFGDLDAADVASLQAALADAHMSSAGIARALTSEGHRISPGSVSRHRRGECVTS